MNMLGHSTSLYRLYKQKTKSKFILINHSDQKSGQDSQKVSVIASNINLGSRSPNRSTNFAFGSYKALFKSAARKDGPKDGVALSAAGACEISVGGALTLPVPGGTAGRLEKSDASAFCAAITSGGPGGPSACGSGSGEKSILLKAGASQAPTLTMRLEILSQRKCAWESKRAVDKTLDSFPFPLFSFFQWFMESMKKAISQQFKNLHHRIHTLYQKMQHQ